MDYNERKIKQSIRLGNTLFAFWNDNRERIYLYDKDKDEIICSCSNLEYVELSKKVNLPINISQDVETLRGLMDHTEFLLGEVK